MHFHRICLSLAAGLVISAYATAQPISGNPITPADAAGKTGAFPLALSERNPLSTPDAITKRFHVKPQEMGEDYDLSQEVFDLYVPPQPDENGKYGLMVAIPWTENHAYAPAGFRPVLDKNHLIWIGPYHGGEDKSALQNIGEALDSVSNARKIWHIDDRRIYLSNNNKAKFVSGIGLEYPDLFTGTISALAIPWFQKLQDPQTKLIWDTDNCQRPIDRLYALDKYHSRFLIAHRLGDGAKFDTVWDLVFRQGYKQAGFRYIKMLDVPQADMGHWVAYTGGWFEQSVQFLDSPLTEIAANTTTQPTDAQPAPSTTAPADAPEQLGVTPPDAGQKIGAFRITLSKRSPLSAPDEIAKRLKIKPEQLGSDYDLSKQVFEIYVPPQPNDDGKYGVMVAIVFAEGHGFAPSTWRPILDKYHLIWIGPVHGGEDQPMLQRFGEALDSAHNAKKIWPIDEQRVYVCINTQTKILSGIGVAYPDLFDGTISALGMAWWSKIQDTKNRKWDTDTISRPAEALLTLDKSHSRFFFASRDEGPGSVNIEEQNLIFHYGYQQAGFHHIKLVKVPQADMNLWSSYSDDWFEQGIQFLDASSTETAAAPATQPIAEQSSQPTTAPAIASAQIASVKPDNRAASALSLAKSYVASEKYDLARPRLQKIIDEYPNTPAAAEAAAILQQIEGK
jgi:tetratricopeptide (TPR) repeat protein